MNMGKFKRFSHFYTLYCIVLQQGCVFPLCILAPPRVLIYLEKFIIMKTGDSIEAGFIYHFRQIMSIPSKAH
jgi:hypothetical protein